MANKRVFALDSLQLGDLGAQGGSHGASDEATASHGWSRAGRYHLVPGAGYPTGNAGKVSCSYDDVEIKLMHRFHAFAAYDLASCWSSIKQVAAPLCPA